MLALSLPMATATNGNDCHYSHIKDSVAGPSSQPYTVQVIQLEECLSPPPEAQPRFNLSSLSRHSSSACSSDDDDEEDEECSSYCSSEAPEDAEEERMDCDVQEEEDDSELDVPSSPSPYDTHGLRMKRILSWRENFSALLSAMDGMCLSQCSLLLLILG
jgi:hypothetical protein